MTRGEPRATTGRGARRSGWVTDLGIGLRMSLGGGRSGWVRLLLIAGGTGLGVAMLLVVASLPTVVGARAERTDARAVSTDIDLARGDDTLLTAVVRSGFRAVGIEGRLLQPEGPRAPVPPGVRTLPAPGEVVLSPALAQLMDSPDGAALRGRWGDRVVGTIGPEGLAGPAELTFYLGTDELDQDTGTRIDRFGVVGPVSGPDGALLLLGLVGLVVVLVPVLSFIATAARFGGEARDRRLAALRLVGADAATTRRVAAGESLAGAVAGLVVGALLFALVRQVAAPLVPPSMTFYREDLRPAPLLTALVVVLVPLASVVVTVSALRRVVVEPLGVVRRATVTRRRLWWRLVLPVAGLALMSPVLGGVLDSVGQQLLVTAGLACLLIGLGGLLPWLLEVVVERLGGGGVSWQLAVRRLQLESGTSVRAVSAIVVAVAGLIAMQGLTAGVTALVERQRPVAGGFQALVLPNGDRPAEAWVAGLAGRPGVTDVVVTRDVVVADEGSGEEIALRVAPCGVLAYEVGDVSCRDGDVLVVAPAGAQTPAPGTSYVLGDAGESWTVPADVRTVQPDPDAFLPENAATPVWLYVTPGALGDLTVGSGVWSLFVALDPQDPDAVDLLRTAAAAIDPTAYVSSFAQESLTGGLGTVSDVLAVGTAALLVVIGASLLVNVVEQLRERRRLLAVLAAFGVRRRVLGLSVLWQVAIPVVLGLALAVVVGSGLAAVLQAGTGAPPGVDWRGVGATAGSAALVVLATTAASLPLLVRLTRPEGLRAE